ncbi:alpha-L-glutamate ligase-related protein [Flavobacteriaceae bacterium MAR_2010_188]|nr:alpha-L-glutamate ligase-related protein [Flavobacteriaceae bacterium MAR_2010_188]
MFKKILNFTNPNGVIGLNQRNLELIYTKNKREDYKLADDKIITKNILHEADIACAETYQVIYKIKDIENAWKNCQQYQSLAIKPANGSGGGGIMIVRKSKDGGWLNKGQAISDHDIMHHITSIVSGFFSRGDGDSCLIEECIVPHHFFTEIYNEGVPDFRIITLNSKPLMAMLRMPTSKSGGMANLHQQGVGIGVDMKTGKLTEVYDGKTYSNYHPDSPKLVTGLEIPFWEEILDLSIKTSKAFPLKYLGIDLVIDKVKGPQIMEINVRPGLAIQMVNRCGLQQAREQHFIPTLQVKKRYKRILENATKWDHNLKSIKFF